MADLAAAYWNKSPSLETKTTLAALHLGILLLGVWLLLGGGIRHVDALLNREPHAASRIRIVMLAGAALFYFLRTLITLFVFVRRRMPYIAHTHGILRG